MDNTAVTTGTFDGVHAGHRFLLDRLCSLCHADGSLRPLVLVLDPHPLEVVAPGKAPGLIMTASERCGVIRSLYPAADVKILGFTEDLRHLTHEGFMRRLRDDYGARMILLGHDHRFGSDRGATRADYIATARSLGIGVEECPALPGVSSSIIRGLIAAGDVESAAAKLCAPYELSGTVVHGNALGATIGFPTANLHPSDSRKMIPADGVYAGFAAVSSQIFPAMVNIGVNPTVGGNAADPKRIEAHLIGFSGDLYGRPLSISFCRRLRGERRFPSLDALKEQLRQDLDRTVDVLKDINVTPN